MTDFTITVPGPVMWRAARSLGERLGRMDSAVDPWITEKEFSVEFDCDVGKQQYDQFGARTNQRDLTFRSEADAMLFLLRWS
jgi:hypothetical protein